MALSDKQKQRIAGIVHYLNDLLDKRFAQAARITPSITGAEADIRWHQMEIMRQILERGKGFGPIKVVVGDILCSTDEEKKRALFNPTDQVSIMNEIIPAEEEEKAKRETRRAGQLEIRNVKGFYRALDPSLDKILTLMQTWIWWDLLDAAELYRFDVQEQRLQTLKSREFDASMVDFYRKEMAIRPGVDITKEDVLKFELDRTKAILDRWERLRAEEPGYQAIVVSEERKGSIEADMACIKLAKRLMAIEKVRSQKDAIDDAVKSFYAPQLGIPPAQITAQMVLEYEEVMVRRERQNLTELLVSGCKMGATANYKVLKQHELKKRLDALHKMLGVTMQAPAAQQEAHAAG